MASIRILPLLIAFVFNGLAIGATVKRKPAAPVRKAPVVKKAVPRTRVVATRKRRPVARRPVLIAKPVAMVTVQDLPELIPPVERLKLSELSDSFLTRRGNIVHQAIDIMRPLGDPLVAVTDGVIQKVGVNPLGGLTVYLVDAAGKYCYYYAHLSGYAEGLAEGQAVRQGDVIGYVGDTGNARGGPPHLHFQITKIRDENWWTGAVVNPYPLLKKAALAALGDGILADPIVEPALSEIPR